MGIAERLIRVDEKTRKSSAGPDRSIWRCSAAPFKVHLSKSVIPFPYTFKSTTFRRG